MNTLIIAYIRTVLIQTPGPQVTRLTRVVERVHYAVMSQGILARSPHAITFIPAAHELVISVCAYDASTFISRGMGQTDRRKLFLYRSIMCSRVGRGDSLFVLCCRTNRFVLSTPRGCPRLMDGLRKYLRAHACGGYDVRLIVVLWEALFCEAR